MNTLDGSNIILTHKELMNIIYKLVIFSSIVFSFAWYSGYSSKTKDNEKELKIASKEEFVRAVSWAIEQNLLIVNSNVVDSFKNQDQILSNCVDDINIDVDTEIYDSGDSGDSGDFGVDTADE